MKRLSYYTTFIVGYGIVGVMLYDTITWGFYFPTHDHLYALSTDVMVILGILWIAILLPKHVIALRYRHSLHALKTTARLRYGPSYTPFVSVIIPAYNEEVGIVSTLKTLVKSTYRSMEILVIDDGSQDQTGWVVQQFIAHYQAMAQSLALPIRYSLKTNGGKGSALNYGIQQARGSIICTFDADCVVDPHCIERFVSYFIEPTVMACSGNIKMGNKETFLSLIQHLEYLIGFQMKKAESLLGTVFVIGGAAAAFRREVFIRLGGYNTSMLTEDMELSFRMQQAGMKILYTEDALVYTEGPTTLRGLLKQRLRWKRGCIETLSLYRTSCFLRSLTNKRFFWLTIPLTYMQYVQSIFSFLGVLLLFWYCLGAFNFEPILVMILFSSGIYTLLFLSDSNERKLSSFLLVPITWCLFCAMSCVEIYALLKATWTLIRKQEVTWQKWQRQGVISR